MVGADHRRRGVLHLLGGSARFRLLRPSPDGRLAARRTASGLALASLATSAGDPAAGGDRGRDVGDGARARSPPAGCRGARVPGWPRVAPRAGPGVQHRDHDRHAARLLRVSLDRRVRRRGRAPVDHAVCRGRDGARPRLSVEVLCGAPRPRVPRLCRRGAPRDPRLGGARGRGRRRAAVRAAQSRLELRALLGQLDVQRLQPARRGRIRLVPTARVSRGARVRRGPAAAVRRGALPRTGARRGARSRGGAARRVRRRADRRLLRPLGGKERGAALAVRVHAAALHGCRALARATTARAIGEVRRGVLGAASRGRDRRRVASARNAFSGCASTTV